MTRLRDRRARTLRVESGLGHTANSVKRQGPLCKGGGLLNPTREGV